MSRNTVNKSDRIHVRCSADLRRELDDIAARMGEGVAVVARMAVREFIERHGHASEGRP
ncbi:MAG: hypothetical protein JWM36_4730 [Hyphomicrobiales bacterium]|nr:hypothetical protein [Hyphomicrobiales bacterium]